LRSLLVEPGWNIDIDSGAMGHLAVQLLCEVHWERAIYRNFHAWIIGNTSSPTSEQA
jgi:hypothetical protein